MLRWRRGHEEDSFFVGRPRGLDRFGAGQTFYGWQLEVGHYAERFRLRASFQIVGGHDSEGYATHAVIPRCTVLTTISHDRLSLAY